MRHYLICHTAALLILKRVPEPPPGASWSPDRFIEAWQPGLVLNEIPFHGTRSKPSRDFVGIKHPHKAFLQRRQLPCDWEKLETLVENLAMRLRKVGDCLRARPESAAFGLVADGTRVGDEFSSIGIGHPFRPAFCQDTLEVIGDEGFERRIQTFLPRTRSPKAQ